METGHYKTPGTLVREAREAKGIGIAELATETRISERMLSALEDDNYAQLNGPLYVKSFLRSCAEFLDLDVDLLLRHFDLMSAEAEPETEGDDVWQRVETRVHHVSSVSRRIPIAIAVLAVLVVVIGLAIRFIDGRRASGPSEPGPGTARTESPAETPAETAEETAGGTATAPERVDPGGTDSVREGDDAPEARLRAAVPTDPVVRPDPRVLDAMTALPAGDRSLKFSGNRSWPLVLRLVFTRPTDYAIAADQQRETRSMAWPTTFVHGLPDEEIVPGQLYTVGSSHIVYWGANDHFLLKLDSAEGVTASLNGRVLPIPKRIVGREWVLDDTLVGR